MGHPVFPHPRQPWVPGEPSLPHQQRDSQGLRHRPNTAAPCPLPAAPRDCTYNSVRGTGAEKPPPRGRHPAFSCHAPSLWETSPEGSSEARFTLSSQTLLLLPGSLGGRRHRSHPRCCSPHPPARVSPRAARAQGDGSGFPFRFEALPQTAGAKQGRVSGRGRGGKGAADPTLRYELRGLHRLSPGGCCFVVLSPERGTPPSQRGGGLFGGQGHGAGP